MGLLLVGFPVNNTEPKIIKICPDRVHVCLVAITKKVNKNIYNDKLIYLCRLLFINPMVIFMSRAVLNVLLLSTHILFSPACVMCTNSS